jgi:hypothetical protein
MIFLRDYPRFQDPLRRTNLQPYFEGSRVDQDWL